MNDHLDSMHHDIGFRRIYTKKRDRESWFELYIPGVLESDTLDGTDRAYIEFCKWFVKECKGCWAYPSPGVLLFELEEDKFKVILKYV